MQTKCDAVLMEIGNVTNQILGRVLAEIDPTVVFQTHHLEYEQIGWKVYTVVLVSRARFKELGVQEIRLRLTVAEMIFLRDRSAPRATRVAIWHAGRVELKAQACPSFPPTPKLDDVTIADDFHQIVINPTTKMEGDIVLMPAGPNGDDYLSQMVRVPPTAYQPATEYLTITFTDFASYIEASRRVHTLLIGLNFIYGTASLDGFKLGGALGRAVTALRGRMPKRPHP